MDKFQIIQEIGSGAFSDVLQAQNKQTGEIVAVKRMKRKFQSWDECINLREIKSLRKIEHPNIIKMKEVIKDKDELYLIFEFQKQNIYQLYQIYKEKGQFLQEKQIQTIIYQTISALAHMHKHGFFHRDMKPENLLVNDGCVKICDFGLAREIRSRPPFTEYVSTRWYRAPEIILKSPNYNSPVDIFALGCIMAELYLMSPLFCGNSEIDQLNKICQVLGAPNQWPEGQILMTQNKIDFNQYNPIPLDKIIQRASPEAIQLISDMLKWDPSKRPTAQQILKYDYFANYDQQNCKLINNQFNENNNSNVKQRDFRQLNKDESFNISQFICESSKEQKKNQDDSFNLSEIIDDIDNISIEKKNNYNKNYDFQMIEKKNNPNIQSNNQDQEIKLQESNQSIFQNTTNRNALKNSSNQNNQKLYQINYQNKDDNQIKGRYNILK